MKRKLLAGLVAAALVTVGVVGGVVLAQEGEEEESDSDSSSTFFERVAEILDVESVDADDLEDAFKQAKHDLETDRISEYLDQLVEKEVIDQETADEYLEWYGDRPQSLPNFGLKRGLGGRGFSSWLKDESRGGTKVWHFSKHSRSHFWKESISE